MAWDISKTGGASGSGGCRSADFTAIATTSSKALPIIPQGPAATACFTVYNYLANAKTGQAATPSTYASNPLWQIVDGPWKLKSLSTTTGNTVFVPNTAYSGPVKPRLAEFEELGFTTDTAEYQALRSRNKVDVGYLPPADAPPTTGSFTSGERCSC